MVKGVWPFLFDFLLNVSTISKDSMSNRERTSIGLEVGLDEKNPDFHGWWSVQWRTRMVLNNKWRWGRQLATIEDEGSHGIRGSSIGGRNALISLQLSMDLCPPHRNSLLGRQNHQEMVGGLHV